MPTKRSTTQKPTARRHLTAADIDQAMINMANLVLSDEPGDREKLIALAGDIVERGGQRELADWAGDKRIGPDRAAFLHTLAATKDHEEGLERLALMAARSIRLQGVPDAATITVATFISTPAGNDLLKNKISKTKIPEGVRYILEGMGGEDLEHMFGVGRALRAERVARLFGYVYSGLLGQDMEQGILTGKSGAHVIGRSNETCVDVRLLRAKMNDNDGSNTYDITIRRDFNREGLSAAHRVDVAYLNEKDKILVVGEAFSDDDASGQNVAMHKHIGALVDASKTPGNPLYGWRVVPFYLHSGTFVPNDQAEREGYRTTMALNAAGVSDGDQAKLATLTLMSVALMATTQEQVQSFFLCNPLVGGTSTLEHLRHVERTAGLAPKEAMEEHVRFLSNQVCGAIRALSEIPAATGTGGVVTANLNILSKFLETPAGAFGGMSQSTYAQHWEPMLRLIEDKSLQVVKTHGAGGGGGSARTDMTPWSTLWRKARAMRTAGFEEFRDIHEQENMMLGKDDSRAGRVDACIQQDPTNYRKQRARH